MLWAEQSLSLMVEVHRDWVWINQSSSEWTIMRFLNRWRTTQHYGSPKFPALGRGSEDESSKKINVHSLAISFFDFGAHSWGYGQTNVAWGGSLYPNSFSLCEVCLWIGRETWFHKQSDLPVAPPIDNRELRQAKQVLERFLPWGILSTTHLMWLTV